MFRKSNATHDGRRIRRTVDGVVGQSEGDACKPVPCMGTGVVDEDTYVLDEERKRELEEFAGDCIRNSGGDPDMPNSDLDRTDPESTATTEGGN